MKYDKRTFDGDDVLLDGNVFIHCTFNHCKVIFMGIGTVYLSAPVFNACTWHLSGPAANTVNFLADIYAGGGEAKELVEATFNNIRAGKRIPARQ